MTGSELIAIERQRQIDEEGWTAKHDSKHTDFCLSVAAASYALDAAVKHADLIPEWKNYYLDVSEGVWPFDEEWFKPTADDPVRQLVKAGALIAAEIDRLQRIR